MTIRLVTRGDDSGTCENANLAIRDAFVSGMLKNTSLMVPPPALDHAAEVLADLPGLCVGLHVTLTSEVELMKWGPVLPVEKVPSIVNRNGHFYHHVREVAEHAAVGELIAEVQAQLDLARARGFNIEYMDEHMLVGAVPGLRNELDSLGDREGLDHSHLSLAALPSVEGEFESPLKRFIARLGAAEPGTYMVVGHPCYDTEEVRRLWTGRPVPVGHMRDWERRYFMDPEVLEYCSARGIEAIRFTDLPAA